jgi:hypothetical protein
VAATLTITLMTGPDGVPPQILYSWILRHEDDERGWGYGPDRATALAAAQEVASDFLDPDEPETIEIIDR